MLQNEGVRHSLLTITGCLIGLLLLALAPTLLRQSLFDSYNDSYSAVRLIPMQMEEFLDQEEIEPEPEPPPEPEIEPEPPEFEPPEIEMEIEPPQTTYSGTSPAYSSDVRLPSLSDLKLKGGAGASRLSKSTRPPLPDMPQHGPPRTRFNSDEVDQQPRGVATMQPVYPYRAKRLNIEGAVRIRFLVNRSGNTDLISILNSQPPGEFDKSVKTTVKRWRFKPAIKDGQPVETWVETTIEFRLR